MTAANKPENQNSHASLSDLGQITFNPYTHNGETWITIKRQEKGKAICEDTPATKRRYIDSLAGLEIVSIYELCTTLDEITCTNKEAREWAKKKIREWAAQGKAIYDDAQRAMREFEAKSANPEIDLGE